MITEVLKLARITFSFLCLASTTSVFTVSSLAEVTQAHATLVPLLSLCVCDLAKEFLFSSSQHIGLMNKVLGLPY